MRREEAGSALSCAFHHADCERRAQAPMPAVPGSSRFPAATAWDFKNGAISARSARPWRGHGAVVGADGARPDELVEVLQGAGILKPTPPAQRLALARLLSTL